MQRTLSAEQVEAFHHDLFVEDQVRHFAGMLPGRGGGRVVDVGGGCGYFVRRLHQLTDRPVRVIDTDQASLEICRAAGIEARDEDALAPQAQGDEEVISFNLVLHHLVGSGEQATRALQIRALLAWRGKVTSLFVNEYIYESFVANLSGRLIFAITSSRILSALGRAVATVVPAFRANTFGVGVRFRAHDEWVELFSEAGFEVVDRRIGEPEPVAAPLRLMFIRQIRRDSFVLRAAPSFR